MRHIRRDVPPWARISRHTNCGRRIGTRLTVIDRAQWTAEATAAVGERLFPRLTNLAEQLDACSICVQRAYSARTWNGDPLACLEQYAEFVNGHGDATVTRRALAELNALLDLANADRDAYEALVTRHEALMALAGPR